MDGSNYAPTQLTSCDLCTLVAMLPGKMPGSFVLLGKCGLTGELFASSASIRRVVAVRAV